MTKDLEAALSAYDAVLDYILGRIPTPPRPLEHYPHQEYRLVPMTQPA